MVEGNSANHNFSKSIKLFYNDPKRTAEIFEIITELSIHYATAQAMHGIDAFQLFETHAGLIPSDQYIERVMPYVNRITNAVRAKNVPTIFFPKGLGDGLSKMNQDVADFISVDWQMPLSVARKMIDAKVGVQGNIDQRVFSVEDKSIIEKELSKFLDFGKTEYKWIFNTGHGLMPDNLFENVKFVVEWVKNANWNRD